MGSFFFRPVVSVSRREAHGDPTPPFFRRDSTEIWAKKRISGDLRVWFHGDFCTDRFRKIRRIRANWTCTQVFFFFQKKKIRSEIRMAFQGLVCSLAHTPHTTTQHTIPHIIHQYHAPPQGPTRPHRSPHMAGRPPGEKRKRGGFHTRAAGRFGGKPAPPPEPLAADTRPQHDNDTCYEGDEADHSSSGSSQHSSGSSQHSSDSDLSSCGSCSSGG